MKLNIITDDSGNDTQEKASNTASEQPMTPRISSSSASTHQSQSGRLSSPNSVKNLMSPLVLDPSRAMSGRLTDLSSKLPLSVREAQNAHGYEQGRRLYTPPRLSAERSINGNDCPENQLELANSTPPKSKPQSKHFTFDTQVSQDSVMTSSLSNVREQLEVLKQSFEMQLDSPKDLEDLPEGELFEKNEFSSQVFLDELSEEHLIFVQWQKEPEPAYKLLRRMPEHYSYEALKILKEAYNKFEALEQQWLRMREVLLRSSPRVQRMQTIAENIYVGRDISTQSPNIQTLQVKTSPPIVAIEPKPRPRPLSYSGDDDTDDSNNSDTSDTSSASLRRRQ